LTSVMTPSEALKSKLERQAVSSIQDDLAARATLRQRERSLLAEASEDFKRLGLKRDLPRGLTPPASSLGRNRFPVPFRSGPLKPADVIWVYAAPYDFKAVNHGGDGVPDQRYVDADPANGVLNVVQIIEDGNATSWGFAGIGTWFTPRTADTTAVQVRARLSWTYRYALGAGLAGETAHADGAVGIRIFSWDANGGDQQQLTEEKSLWSVGVDLWDYYEEASDDGSTSLSQFFAYDPRRHYAACVYVAASIDAGGYPNSQASAFITGEEPLLVTEEWGFDY
jgi:hypothetical protein